MFNLLPRASTYEPTSSFFLAQLDKHRQEGGAAILSLVFGGSSSFNLKRRHEHFGIQGIACDKRTYDCGSSCVMTHDIFGRAGTGRPCKALTLGKMNKGIL